MRFHIQTLCGCGALVAGVGTIAQGAALIGSVSVLNSDAAITNGVQAQRENDLGGTIVPFGEDAFGFTDRTHQWNGARFNAAGVLSTGTAAGDIVIGLPSYLMGGEYVSTLLTNRDNATFQMQVTVNQAVNAYLLIDNRVGDGAATNAANLSGTTMAWVNLNGWVLKNTGLSPNGQPDFGGIDEGATITDFTNRATTTTGLSTGPGNGLNNFFTIYQKSFNAGDTINLFEQNDGTSRDMYGLVVTQTPEPASLGSLALLGVAAFIRRPRR